MIKNVSLIVHQVGQKFFQIYCEQDSTTAELKELANQLIGRMCKIEELSAEAQPKTEDATEVVKED